MVSFLKRVILGLVVSSGVVGQALAVAPAVTILPESTKPIAVVLPNAPAPAHRAYVSREMLTVAETNAPMTFEVVLKLRNVDELKARVEHGEVISTTEMALRYAPLATDYQAVTDWLAGEGFSITRRDSHHMAVFARGKVGRVAKALQVSFSRVNSDGVEFTSAVTSPGVPTKIARLLTGINGLQPHLRAHRNLRMNPHPDAAAGSAPYIPSQIAQAYAATGLYNMNITGAGQTIAIVIDAFPSTADLELFWQQCNVSQSINNIEFVQTVQGVMPGPSGEETLDVQWASAMAPAAHVRVYGATDLSDADLDASYQQVYDDVTNHPEYGIHQMSMSYGEGETYTTHAQVNTDDQYFLELAAAGVTCFASSGDEGATPGPGGTGDESGVAQAESPASDPYVTGVGGTSLKLDTSNNEKTEVVWNDADGASSGGVSIYFARPSWQVGTGVPLGIKRVVPDVAASADPEFGAVTYVNGVKSTVGGTSWSAPTWAGLCALLNQARANAGQAPLGVLGAQIYPLLGTSDYATNFRDIVSGNNSTSGSNGFAAKVGYDPCTGVGVPKTQALAQTLIGSSVLAGVQGPVAEFSTSPGLNAALAVTVSGTSATYQWQRLPASNTTWSNLGNDSTYSGAGSASLTVTNATTSMSGDQFRCAITLAGNIAVTTRPSVLAVETPLLVSTFSGTAGTTGLTNGTGLASRYHYPSGVALDSGGNVYIADYSNNVIRKITPAGVATTAYGSVSGLAGTTNGAANTARFRTPNGIAADSSDNLYVADTGNNLIRKIVAGTVSTLASTGFDSPEGIAVDALGNVYVADTNNEVIRKITSAGVVSTLAGQVGASGYADGNGTQALFDTPLAVAVDSSGNVYVGDYGNYVIRKITPAGVVSTLAGQATVSGYLDGPGAKALFNTPSGVAVDSSNNVYVCDSLPPQPGSNAAGNNLLRKITPAGIVSTLAGQGGTNGTANGSGTAAQFFSVQALALTGAGSAYLADTYNQTIRLAAPPLSSLATISVATTQATASVFGPVAGQFTITRSGSTTASLTVNYSVSGTAVSNTDYTALLGTVTIPSGASSAVVSVNPLSNANAASNPTVQITLTASSAYNVGNPTAATVTIQEPSSYQSWKISKFGSNANVASIAGDTADPNNNGVPNLLEYAFNANPLQAGTVPSPTLSVVNVSGQNYVAITFTKLTTDSSLTYTVQVTSDLAQLADTWQSGSSFTTVVSQVANGSASQVTVRDNTPISSTGTRFIRLQVTKN